MRHIVRELFGLIVALNVRGGDGQKRDDAPSVLAAIRKTDPWPRHVFADGGNAEPTLKGALAQIGGRALVRACPRTAAAQCPHHEAVRCSEGFEVLPSQWLVERHVAGLVRCRASANN